MKEKIKKLKEQVVRAAAAARAVLEKAEGENRDLNAEEKLEYDRATAEIQSTRSRIDRLEAQLQTEDEMRQVPEPAARPELAAAGAVPGDRRSTKEYQDSFRSYLRMGPNGLRSEEARALQADADTDGGYLVPQVFAKDLLKAVDDILWIRKLATVHQLGQADSLGIPSLDADPADADWTVELGTGSEDSSMKLGKREMKPNPLAKRLKVSNKLLRLVPDVESLVRSRLAYKLALPQEKAFMTGDGAGKPLGLFTASDNGIPTSRDKSTGNTTTSITHDGIIEAKYHLKPQYWPKAQWVFHRDATKQIVKLKDGDGQYMWQPSLQAGQPDRLHNLPLNMSEYAPNTFTTGQYVGMLADYSFYHIAEGLNISVQRLVELYAEANQVGFIVRTELDAMPVLAEAFVRVKLA